MMFRVPEIRNTCLCWGMVLGVLLFGGAPLLGQITITDSDMPAPGDSIIFSMADTIFDVQELGTGTNYTWNFQHLHPRDQSMDSFIGMSDVAGVYQFAFWGIANLVQPTADFDSIGSFFPSTQIKAFINNTSSAYEITGLGIDMDSQPLPVVYDSPDVVYHLPLTYGDKDSSVSTFSISFSGFYYGRWQKRINKVDGWGTLQAPLGSFSVLRVKTQIYTEDSIYTDSTGGSRIVRSPEINYKWLGKGEDLPLLRVNSLIISGDTILTSIAYQDTLCIPVAQYNYQDSNLTVQFSEQSRWGQSFFWDFGDGAVSTQTAPSHTYQQDGRYEVCLYTSNDCGSDVFCDSVEVTAPDTSTVLQEYDLSSNGKVFPNPFRSTIHVRVEKSLLVGSGKIHLQMYDLHGHRADIGGGKIEVTEEGDALLLTIEDAGLENGIYILKVLQGAQPVTVNKVVVQGR